MARAEILPLVDAAGRPAAAAPAPRRDGNPACQPASGPCSRDRHVSHGLFSLSDRPIADGSSRLFQSASSFEAALPATVTIKLDPAQLQDQFDADGIRARLRLLRAKGPDGVPLWLGALILPGAMILAAFITAIARGLA